MKTPNGVPAKSRHLTKTYPTINFVDCSTTANRSAYRRSSSASTEPLRLSTMRNKCIKMDFQTPSSNSCSRSTTSIRKKLKPVWPSLSEKAFWTVIIRHFKSMLQREYIWLLGPVILAWEGIPLEGCRQHIVLRISTGGQQRSSHISPQYHVEQGLHAAACHFPSQRSATGQDSEDMDILRGCGYWLWEPYYRSFFSR